MKYLLVIAVLLNGCNEDKSAPPPNKETVVSKSLKLYTVVHDGHSWVVSGTGGWDSGGSLVHHPDCVCGKSK